MPKTALAHNRARQARENYSLAKAGRRRSRENAKYGEREDRAAEERLRELAMCRYRCSDWLTQELMAWLEPDRYRSMVRAGLMFPHFTPGDRPGGARPSRDNVARLFRGD